MFTQKDKLMNTILELEANELDCPNSATVNEYDLIKMILILDDGNDLDYVFANYEDSSIYEVSSYKELAEQFCDEGVFGDIPKHLINYIDYEAMGRDLKYDYSEGEVDGITYFYRYQ